MSWDGGVIDLESCLPIFVLNWKPWIIQWLLHQLRTLGLGFKIITLTINLILWILVDFYNKFCHFLDWKNWEIFGQLFFTSINLTILFFFVEIFTEFFMSQKKLPWLWYSHIIFILGDKNVVRILKFDSNQELSLQMDVTSQEKCL